VVVAVVDVREKRKRMAARSKPTASLCLSLLTQLSTCTAPASPRARPNPDVGGISPVIKTSSASYLIDIHLPHFLPTWIFLLMNVIDYITCINHLVFVAMWINGVLQSKPKVQHPSTRLPVYCRPLIYTSQLSDDAPGKASSGLNG
jgi:hypothetical protein